jgi:hypothetical protein
MSRVQIAMISVTMLSVIMQCCVAKKQIYKHWCSSALSIAADRLLFCLPTMTLHFFPVFPPNRLGEDREERSSASFQAENREDLILLFPSIPLDPFLLDINHLAKRYLVERHLINCQLFV